jgi:hypothetical protein
VFLIYNYGKTDLHLFTTFLFFAGHIPIIERQAPTPIGKIPGRDAENSRTYHSLHKPDLTKPHRRFPQGGRLTGRLRPAN